MISSGVKKRVAQCRIRRKLSVMSSYNINKDPDGIWQAVEAMLMLKTKALLMAAVVMSEEKATWRVCCNNRRRRREMVMQCVFNRSVSLNIQWRRWRNILISWCVANVKKAWSSNGVSGKANRRQINLSVYVCW